MAFTNTQKDKAISHLGFSVDSWSIGYIGQKLDAISSLSPEAETRVIAILTQMDSIETTRNTYLADSGVQVKTNGVVYYQGQAIAELNYQYKYWQSKLATALGLTLFKDQGSKIVRS